MITRKPKRNVRAALAAAGIVTTTEDHQPGDAIYAQGDPADCVLYILDGGIKLSVVSPEGREAVVAVLGPDEFFGEGAMAEPPARTGSATAISLSRVLAIPRAGMLALLHQQRDMSDRFIAHMLLRNVSLETGLIDQLFNSNQTRSVRTH
ncbi:MAG: cyclic nucleotide-binding domain-containing protein [Acidobacteria bacterium]|nr:cyclic nucleotide-binding domain-containing protein [Acidobacteriota bacterium]